MAIFLGDLPQLFAVGICRRYVVYVSKPFFCVCKSFFFVNKPFLNESNLFYVSKTILFMRIPLIRVFLFAIAVAVVGHRNIEIAICLLKFFM